jgi:ribonuclease P/MRP protein subunit RPP40
VFHITDTCTAPNADPLPQHSPTTFTCDPAITQNTEVLIPKLSVEADPESPDSQAHLEDYAIELYEWLSLVRLQSPRVQVGDQIDPYLSRYRVPEGSSPGKVCKISWEGFLAPSWTREMLVELILAVPPTAWFAFSATTFTKSFAGDNSECTILRLPEGTGQYLMWEVKAHE